MELIWTENNDKEINHNDYNTLKKVIDYHMNLYYNEDSPEISDYEYDQLMLKLKDIESEHPEWITPESPSQKIGGIAKREAGIKVTHDVPMLSILDVFDKQSVVDWINKVHSIHPDCTFSVETKIDGLSATIRYVTDNNGKLHLTLCETRGDGLIGEDVTKNALVIPDIKQIINLPYDSLQLRGEVYMSHEDFERYNNEQNLLGKKMAANPRNLAAGTLRQLDPNITKNRGLKIFVFNVQQGPDSIMQSHCDSLDLLASKGIPVVYHKKCYTSEEVLSVIDEIAAMRKNLEYDIDGAVIKINEIKYRNDFPSSSAKYSSGHIAYKYPPEEKEVVMDDIIVDVGRTGKLTFTGVFHDKETGGPAQLCGTNVSRVTLHNQDYISDMKVGIGGIYKLFKSGEIIPKLNGCVIPPTQVFYAPTECPICGEALIKEDDTADIRCINPTCPAQTARAISYFVSRDCMNIIGLGETLINTLCKFGYLKNYADIYHLNEFREELILKGILGRDKNTDKLLQAIESSKKNNPVNFLTGLGIRNVGKSTAKDIMKHYNNIFDLLSAEISDLTNINNIGDVTAKSIYDFFHNQNNIRIINDFYNSGINFQMENSDTTSKLNGMTLVVTGTLKSLGRKEIIELIERNGGKCSGSVSKKTTYLIAGEAAGSKLDKAKQLNIPILSEDDFLNMLN